MYRIRSNKIINSYLNITLNGAHNEEKQFVKFSGIYYHGWKTKKSTLTLEIQCTCNSLMLITCKEKLPVHCMLFKCSMAIHTYDRALYQEHMSTRIQVMNQEVAQAIFQVSSDLHNLYTLTVQCLHLFQLPLDKQWNKLAGHQEWLKSRGKITSNECCYRSTSTNQMSSEWNVRYNLWTADYICTSQDFTHWISSVDFAWLQVLYVWGIMVSFKWLSDGSCWNRITTWQVMTWMVKNMWWRITLNEIKNYVELWTNFPWQVTEGLREYKYNTDCSRLSWWVEPLMEEFCIKISRRVL